MRYVYLLQSLKDQDLYTGYTSDLRRRFREHTGGKVTSTRDRRPLKLIYYEAYLLEADAKGRERFLKSGAGKRYLRKQLKHYLQNKPSPLGSNSE